MVIDDSRLQCKAWRRVLEDRFGDAVAVETYDDPTMAVDHLSADLFLILLDWEMPHLDGEAVLELARQRGVDPKRVIVTSGHPAERLHQIFEGTGCLAVIDKTDAEQRAAFLMILDELADR
jgi:CheY-like chemotaxis protein